MLLRELQTGQAFLQVFVQDLGPSGIEVPQVEDEATVVEALGDYDPLNRLSKVWVPPPR